jgi:uncharacterized protein with NAD-binding domain and iron-sulfur cluster
MWWLLACLRNWLAPKPKGSTAPPPLTGKPNVVILGGGAAGVAAAFWLSAPEVRDRLGKITLYTKGWRLGGKCATGRNLKLGGRIEEHGLHMLLGCYQNAFRTIRRCYSEWRPRAGAPFHSWSEAFTAKRTVTLMEQDGPGNPPTWEPWQFTFPPLPGNPGDGSLLVAALTTEEERQRSGVGALEFRYLNWLHGVLLPSLPASLKAEHALPPDDHPTWAHGPPDKPLTDARDKLNQINANIGEAIAGMTIADQHFDTPFSELQLSGKRFAIMANLAAAVGSGLLHGIADGPDFYDRLNDLDFREWLRKFGASDEALASAPIRALYDLTFAYRDGDASSIDKGSIAAGVTLRFVLEATIGYNGAPLWMMNAGMGETIFMPLYQVLTSPQRNVQVELFTKVSGIEIGGDGRVGSIKLARQADFVSGSYDPSVVVGGMDCWPSEPDWTQLKNGTALRNAGVDFESSADTTVASVTDLAIGPDDRVVLALPPEVIKAVAPQLAARNAAWATMLGNSRSVATQALQLWLKKTLPQLGWGNGPPVMTSYREPYDSWADMSHLLAREGWPVATAPKTIAYFCGCLNVAFGAPNAGGTALGEANNWLTNCVGALWPNAVGAGGYQSGDEASRYSRANADGSELYVQTPPGTVAHRLSPAQPTFTNLYVAGDWTRTRFSGGCFESAVESGMLVAAAITGFPTGIAGE